MKHAEARHAEVVLVRTPDGAELTVSDDGKGFDIQVRNSETGLGLVSITERARLAGGTVSIVTAAKKGTQVRVQVPIAFPTAADGRPRPDGSPAWPDAPPAIAAHPGRRRPAAETRSPYPVIDGSAERPAAGRLDSFAFPAVLATRVARTTGLLLAKISRTWRRKGSSNDDASARSALLLVAGGRSVPARPRAATEPIGNPVETGPDRSPRRGSILEGRWGLESFEVRPPGKPPIMLKGSGVLNYDDFGNLTMEVRADQASSDLLRAAGIEHPRRRHLHAGPHRHRPAERTSTYFLEGQRSGFATGGGPLALSRPRHWEVTQDTLTLTTKDDSGAPMSISRWRRTP